MTRSRRGPAMLAALTVLWIASGCAAVQTVTEEPQTDVAPDPEVALRHAVMALDAGDYRTARRRLDALARDCAPPSQRVRDRAALLLASIELDLGNPVGRPAEAATMAAQVLTRSTPGDADAALARLLYMLALDRGAEPVDPLSDVIQPGYGCHADPDHVWPGPTPLPAPVLPTSVGRLAALEDTLAIRTDSLRTLHEHLSTSRARTEALEAEIERIRQLLRGPGDRRDPR